MDVSYKKLFKILIDKDLKKTEFAKLVGIGPNTLAKFSKGEHVSMEVLIKICKYFDCTLDDIMDIFPEEDSKNG